jgi:hypothetical protein
MSDSKELADPPNDTPARRVSFSDRGPLVFKLGAISNWLVTLPAIIAPARVAPILGIEDIGNAEFLLRIWAGMAFLWGCMFWEISRDLRGRRPMLKYAWIEKCVTAASVTIAFASGQVGWMCFGLILYTDYLWIPLFSYFDVIMRGGTTEAQALSEARGTA